MNYNAPPTAEKKRTKLLRNQPTMSLPSIITSKTVVVQRLNTNETSKLTRRKNQLEKDPILVLKKSVGKNITNWKKISWKKWMQIIKVT